LRLDRRILINPADEQFSVAQQCSLSGLARSSYYYRPVGETRENLALIERIDKLFTARPENTLLAVFCVDALEEALSRWGKPQIFNTDQGSQFTSHDFLKPLISNEISVSMDSKGRALDNIFIE